MKSSVETLPRIADAEKSRVSVISELIKARLTRLVLLTTLVGFYMGTRGPVNYWLMLHALLGTEPRLDSGTQFERTFGYLVQHAPSFSLRGGTREVLRGIIARGLGVR